MSTVSQQNAPTTAAEIEYWAPNMPNSDMYTLLSAKDAVASMAPKDRPQGPVPRRVVALRTSPLGRFPPWNAAPPPAAASPQAPSAAAAIDVDDTPPSPSTSPADVPASPEAPQQPRSRAIGLGHPSTSRRNMPLTPNSPASPQASVQPRPHITSSTIKRRTERFPARELHAIAEGPATPPPSAAARPVLGTRKRSYAAAVSTEETPKHTASRRVTPTPPSPGSLRCASKPSGVSVSVSVSHDIAAPARRYMSSGSPQAGPTQVQSPRLLFPATMAGSPRFQSLDGAVRAITAAREAEGGADAEAGEERRDAGAGEERRYTNEELEAFYKEDLFLKLKVHASLRIRFAARRLKMLF
ncbi:hypothetical protein DFH09DRAFT_1313268 [Mycena vulgaris]|nr:hypothetical protein DFH09DRAFT_1313268 [Mycena vulgaris]